jgi:hypothetical protein
MLLVTYRGLVGAVVILADKGMDYQRVFMVPPRGHSYVGV